MAKNRHGCSISPKLAGCFDETARGLAAGGNAVSRLWNLHGYGLSVD